MNQQADISKLQSEKRNIEIENCKEKQHDLNKRLMSVCVKLEKIKYASKQLHPEEAKFSTKLLQMYNNLNSSTYNQCNNIKQRI